MMKTMMLDDGDDDEVKDKENITMQHLYNSYCHCQYLVILNISVVSNGISISIQHIFIIGINTSDTFIV